MDKYEKLQADFHAELDNLVKLNAITGSNAEIVRQTFALCARRINRIEAQNFIAFAQSEGLLK
jgi:hypothetical protein